MRPIALLLVVLLGSSCYRPYNGDLRAPPVPGRYQQAVAGCLSVVNESRRNAYVMRAREHRRAIWAGALGVIAGTAATAFVDHEKTRADLTGAIAIGSGILALPLFSQQLKSAEEVEKLALMRWTTLLATARDDTARIALPADLSVFGTPLDSLRAIADVARSEFDVAYFNCLGGTTPAVGMDNPRMTLEDLEKRLSTDSLATPVPPPVPQP
jgi:hypothetical protein